MVNRFTELSRADRFDLQILGRLRLDSGPVAGRAQATGQSCLCNTINLSTSGVLVETGSSIPLGSLLRYTFSLPGMERTLEITGEVVRGEASGEGLRRIRPGAETPRKLQRYGIMFLDLNERDRKVIEEFFATNGKMGL